MPINHIILAGDSIFDNGGYVPNGPCVTEQLKTVTPEDWNVSRIAIDGDCIRHVYSRVANITKKAGYLVLSIGGNDVRGYENLLSQLADGKSLDEILQFPLKEFEGEYARLIDWMAEFNFPFSVCTIYTNVPFVDEFMRAIAPTAIGRFNEVICQIAIDRNIPIIRLDEICTDAADYSAMSPIEPSVIGGQKIVKAVYQHVLEVTNQL